MTLTVCATDVMWIDGEVRDIPRSFAFTLLPFSKSFLNGVLVRAAKRSEHEFARVRMTRINAHARTAFVDFLNDTEIREIKPTINAVHVEVQSHCDDVEVACSLSVAKQRTFNSLSTSQKPELC